MVTSPKDIAAVHRNSTSLVFDGFIHDVMIAMSAQPATVAKLYHRPNKHEMDPAERNENPSAKHFIGLTHDRYLTQLSPGHHLDVLRDNFQRHLDIQLGAELLAREMMLSKGPRRRKVSLLRLCRDILIRCNTNIFFGERLFEIDPGLAETFCTFDDDHWMMLYKMPKTLARHVHASHQRMRADFVKYLHLAKIESPGAAWLIHTMEDGMRALGISEEEMATQLTLVFWS